MLAAQAASTAASRGILPHIYCIQWFIIQNSCRSPIRAIDLCTSICRPEAKSVIGALIRANTTWPHSCPLSPSYLAISQPTKSTLRLAIYILKPIRGSKTKVGGHCCQCLEARPSELQLIHSHGVLLLPFARAYATPSTPA